MDIAQHVSGLQQASPHKYWFAKARQREPAGLDVRGQSSELIAKLFARLTADALD
jgi:hypothetical protein